MKTWVIYDSGHQEHTVEADYLQYEEDGFISFLSWADPQTRSGAGYVASFYRPVSVTLKEEVPQEAEKPAKGARVKVTLKDQDCGGPALFTGHLADTRSPWAFWTRVVPEDDYIDLPPMFRVEGI